ncbi:PQQ-binding-like beta-propeller repeat protein [Patescibacteria group bacterium]|nr:PQQ-binding-like beta-propeller repeat protein [Patescibacteria group bacterium]
MNILLRLLAILFAILPIRQSRPAAASSSYNLLIADRGHNRLIEVAPDKRIIWEYDFHLPRPGLGPDDAFFANQGQTVIANLEEYHQIVLIDYTSKKILWSYGHPGLAGSAPGFLNTPDDAYLLPNGHIIVADIKNNRVIEIDQQSHLVHADTHLLSPNGDTPLANGHLLISEIHRRDLVELNAQWQEVFRLSLPVNYPSDPQLTLSGNYLVSDYSNPGKIVEVDRQGSLIWEYTSGLNHPSIALELPDGHIVATDDLNNRVIIIDKKTNKIIWQYTGVNLPDGVDYRFS